MTVMTVLGVPHISWTSARARAAFATSCLALALAGCVAAPQSGPTPPPGFAVEPKEGVVSLMDARDERWKTVSAGVHTIVFESKSAIVDAVRYATSSAVADPFKDNVRLAIAGTGRCDVGGKRIAVAPFDVIVAPRGIARSCVASHGELTFLNVSLTRSQFDPPPPGGRIKLEGLFALLRSTPLGDSSLATIERTHCCRVAAARIRREIGNPQDPDRFFAVIHGRASLVTPAGRTSAIGAGDLVVMPHGSAYELVARQAPLEVFQIDVNIEGGSK